MAKKPEDEFEITDDDVAGLGAKDPAVVAEVADDAVLEGAEAPKAPAFEASETLKAELDTLRKQNEEIAAESQRRERELAEERAKNAKAETELTDSRIQTIENALALNDGKLREAKAAYAAAMSEGAFDKAADAQDQIASLAVDRKRLQEGRTAIEMQIEQAKEAPVQQRQPTVDDFFNTLPPAQKQWATEHREWFSSPAKNARVIAAHWDAIENQGLREGSPQYFEAIETALGIRQAPEIGRTDAEPRRQQSAPAAPVSRGAPSMTSGRTGNGKIKLPPEMVEAAMIAGLSPSEYYAAMTPEERARIRH